jgi:Predicted membrane protein (DUF2243)
MNTVWDGVFHAVCWICVLVGLTILYSRVTHYRRRVCGPPAVRAGPGDRERGYAARAVGQYGVAVLLLVIAVLTLPLLFATG